MEFVRNYGEKTIEDWKRVIWSDETKINRFGSDGKIWTWDNTLGQVTDRSVTGTVKFGGGSIIIWGCMTWYGPGYISRIIGGMDSQLYIEVLDECIPLTINDYPQLNMDTFIFQQDNDPKHVSTKAIQYLKGLGCTYESGRLLERPPQSPDLNPIENLW